ncbi:MAG: DNA repair protein RecO [Lachnospiraceae bacterium]|nr:DNA repair protein RecO [Lachnospiraceae bacterium]
MISVTGIIVKAAPVLDYDRRLEILTLERGRVAAFVRGARRPKSKLLGTTEQFCFGKFQLRPGGDSYQVSEADITEYFEGLRESLEGAYLGMYFCELAIALSRENADNAQLAKLLFVSLLALERKRLPFRLIRSVFELKAVAVEGHGILLPENRKAASFSMGTRRLLDHLSSTEMQSLFAFQVSDIVSEELSEIASYNLWRVINHPLAGGEVLKELGL